MCTQPSSPISQPTAGEPRSALDIWIQAPPQATVLRRNKLLSQQAPSWPFISYKSVLTGIFTVLSLSFPSLPLHCRSHSYFQALIHQKMISTIYTIPGTALLFFKTLSLRSLQGSSPACFILWPHLSQFVNSQCDLIYILPFKYCKVICRDIHDVS